MTNKGMQSNLMKETISETFSVYGTTYRRSAAIARCSSLRLESLQTLMQGNQMEKKLESNPNHLIMRQLLDGMQGWPSYHHAPFRQNAEVSRFSRLTIDSAKERMYRYPSHHHAPVDRIEKWLSPVP